ncbi:DUF262 domain-containing protein [Shivajiella indica]|uniref:DUF262 domain-containing protein n=1 Tax=Shivajiella indica TaxID=872115 RepID=A0ABW5BET9_9BACT
MSDFKADILHIQELKFAKFRIPEYQRPYVWTIKETRQLWDDILASLQARKTDYRIGTIVLHNNKDQQSLDIVDGQQRLTTLTLLLHLLSPQAKTLVCRPFLQQKQFLHADSIENIKNNGNELAQWIAEELTETERLFHYILQHCSVVQISVSNISEAFQMFDSQNGRGMTLEAYNLLKAFHIRYFNHIADQDKIAYDRAWENAAKSKKDYLKQVISEQLYRTRIWSKLYPAYAFTRKNITEFKGSNMSAIKYPYQNFVNHRELNANGRFIPRMENESLLPSTQINQAIINGTDFFDYVQNYVGMYQLLFEKNELEDELTFFRLFFQEYGTGFKKKGDFYLIELYKSLSMLVFDKFGVLGLRKYYLLLYAYVFRFRLEKKFVKYTSVAQFPAEVIAGIHHAKELLDLNFFRQKALSPISRQANNLNNPIVEQFFKNHFEVKIH